MQTKICCSCKAEKPVECFSRNRSSSDGLKKYCKECASKQGQRYREKHIEKIKSSSREAYRNCREKAEQKTEKQRQEISSKVCSVCKIEKPLSEFYTASMGGFRSYCKECSNKASRAQHIRNRDAYIQRKRQYHKEHKQEIAEYNHRYYKDHTEEIKARVDEWERQNPERAKENQVMYFHRARSRRAGIKSTFTRAEWAYCKAYFSEDGILHCAYCGKPIKNATQDHVIPFSAGGENTANNILPSCMVCNSSKGDKPFEEWYKEQPFYSDERKDKILTYLNC